MFPCCLRISASVGCHNTTSPPACCVLDTLKVELTAVRSVFTWTQTGIRSTCKVAMSSCSLWLRLFQGDSGGPLMCEDDGHWSAIGESRM